MSIEELNELGKYKKIEKIPEGMFKTKMSSKGQAKKSMEEMYKVFVSNKELMEKYPEKTMKAMGYFEVFYMEKLKDEQKTIEKFMLLKILLSTTGVELLRILTFLK